MEREDVRFETPGRDAFAGHEIARLTGEHVSWLSRLMTELIPQEAVFADLRLNESDVQSDLSYGRGPR